MNKGKSIAIALSLVAVLSGCSSEGKSASDSAQMNQTLSMKTDFKFMSDFLKAMKSNGVVCTGLTKRDEIMVKDAGDCDFNGQVLSLTLFASQEAGNQIYSAMESLMSGYLLTSNNWWIQVDDESTAKILEDKLGVRVK